MKKNFKNTLISLALGAATFCCVAGFLPFMEKNKAEWSMRVFISGEKINYPKYILKAIGIVDDEQ